ncbi:MAG: hypothetical protein MR673_03195 [Fusobacterium perfoetens]|uniref:hypothetical protein n=1 Tax=Fusobacterium perfoetens TaxID=852 RepID=UPI0023F510E9|nr:hypothetical protein [Fusobacterium perfoetens]MCI6152117.1 hypothetical protein [Fusobacterium perfoetens]MDY3237992.1 hypothetical protein [Fusobacterium perfoetens]
MKKLLLGIFLAISMMSFSDDMYDYIEDKLELKYQEIIDSKNNKLVIDGIDVGRVGERFYLNIEIESYVGNGNWDKFDKNDYNKIVNQMANEIRNYLEINDNVEVNLIFENKLSDEKKLLDSRVF